MYSAKSISIVAIFTSLIIASDYALAPIPNVKLVFTLAFASTYSLGLKIGTSIAVLSELIWGSISPYGFGGPIIPFLIAGNLVYVLAGWGASRVWGQDIAPVSSLNLVFGSIMAICAFLWDTITNFGTALIASWPHLTLTKFLYFEAFGFPFMVFHELGDFVIGAALAPVIIVYFKRLRPSRNKLLDSAVEGTQPLGSSGGSAV
jgi:hypothetical protein